MEREREREMERERERERGGGREGVKTRCVFVMCVCLYFCSYGLFWTYPFLEELKVKVLLMILLHPNKKRRESGNNRFYYIRIKKCENQDNNFTLELHRHYGSNRVII